MSRVIDSLRTLRQHGVPTTDAIGYIVKQHTRDDTIPPKRGPNQGVKKAPKPMNFGPKAINKVKRQMRWSAVTTAGPQTHSRWSNK